MFAKNIYFLHKILKNNYYEVFPEHCLKGNILEFANI